jgi:hypothetical protein
MLKEGDNTKKKDFPQERDEYNLGKTYFRRRGGRLTLAEERCHAAGMGLAPSKM